jgi:hypothetical protein
MSKVETTNIPVDQLVVGMKFIPKGKEQPVKVFMLSEFYGASIDVYAESNHGTSAYILNRYDTVEVLKPTR